MLPRIITKRKIVVIPHMNTLTKEIKDSCDGIIDDYCILSLFDYELWTDIVDAICSAKFVVSESLHGLIVAEAYGIPNAWVEFKETGVDGYIIDNYDLLHTQGTEYLLEDIHRFIKKRKK